MAKTNPRFFGLSQYRAPFNYELSGRHFHFVLDDGREYSMYFLDGENLQWAAKGQPYQWESYECLKGDETTFFVHFAPAAQQMIHYSFIIDTAQRLVTMVTMEEGTSEYPRLIRVTPYFGAIRVPGRELPANRHSFSDRMAGRHIFWHYNPGFTLQHIYHTPDCIRADSGVDADGKQITPAMLYEKELNSPDPELRREAQEKIDIYARRAEYYPFYEEPSFHIRINERLNLLCFVEEIMISADPEHQNGGGGILLLQDIERVVDYGLCFNRNEYYMVTAYGEENEDKDPLDTKPSPYDWSHLTSMPSVSRNREEKA